MASEKLYDLAYRFRDTRLWKKLSEFELFAVKLADGETGYCNVTGMRGRHIALALYTGEKGYQSFRRIAETDWSSVSSSEESNVAFSMDCLQCSFENRDMLSPEETAEVRRYAAAHKRNLRGANAFAQFDKYEPGHIRWTLETDREVWRLSRALEAVLALDAMLKEKTKEELGIRPLDSCEGRIPLLFLRRGAWQIGETDLPAAAPVWPEPGFPDDLKAARIRLGKKSGIWECAACYMRYPVRDEEDGDTAPWIPLMLVSTDPLTRSLMPPVLSKKSDAEELMEGYASMLLESDTVPKTIRCGDDRSFALLKDLCAKAGIRLERTEISANLREAMDALTEEMGRPEEPLSEEEEADIWEIMAFEFMQNTDEELMKMPPEMKELLLEKAQKGELPTAFSWRIIRLFGN